MSEDSFGDSVTLKFVGGPLDGDNVASAEMRMDYYVQGDSNGHYVWQEGKYLWVLEAK